MTRVVVTSMDIHLQIIDASIIHTSIQITCIHIEMSLVGKDMAISVIMIMMIMMMMTAQYNSVQSCHPGPCYKSL